MQGDPVAQCCGLRDDAAPAVVPDVPGASGAARMQSRARGIILLDWLSLRCCPMAAIISTSMTMTKLLIDQPVHDHQESASVPAVSAMARPGGRKVPANSSALATTAMESSDLRYMARPFSI